MRSILLALSVGAMFLYGFYIMKKVDEFLEEIQKNSSPEQKASEDAVDEQKSDML